MNKTLMIIIAYGIMAAGPAIGTYKLAKNVDKLAGGLSNAVSKLGKMGAKATGKWAKERYNQGEFATARRTSKAFKARDAEMRAFEGMRSGKSRASKWAIKGLGLSEDALKKRGAYLESQADKIYEEDVSNAETLLNKTKENNPNAAVEAFRKSAQSGKMTKAQAHAHVRHLLGMKGGKSSLRTLFKDGSFMTELDKAGGTDGIVLGALSDSKFTAAHPDINNALSYHRQQFLKDAQAGNAHEYLGANFAKGVRTATSNVEVVDSSQKAFQDLQWYIDRPNMVNTLSHDFTSEIYNKISYDDAVTAQKDVASFSTADPGIQGMINAIVAAGDPKATGSTAKNSLTLPAFNPNIAPGQAGGPPEWWHTT